MSDAQERERMRVQLLARRQRDGVGTNEGFAVPADDVWTLHAAAGLWKFCRLLSTPDGTVPKNIIDRMIEHAADHAARVDQEMAKKEGSEGT